MSAMARRKTIIALSNRFEKVGAAAINEGCDFLVKMRKIDLGVCGTNVIAFAIQDGEG